MRKAVPVILAVVFAAAGAIAGEPITIGETLTLSSKTMGEDRTILVSPPADYQQGTGKYPVLYLTDGDGHLTHTRGTVDFLVRNGLMSDVIIVGVTNTDRTRDLTPTKATLTDRRGEIREFPTSGGGGRFLDFFEKELIPYVEKEYRTQPFRIFSGHSFGGLFALNAQFTRPDLFQAVISVSPSLGWDDALPVRQAEEFVALRKAGRGTLYVTMADELEDEPKPDLLDKLEAALSKKELAGFIWAVNRMPDETHGSVVLRSHYWGLRKVFDGWALPRDPETRRFAGGLAEVQAHYAAVSKRFGYVVVPPENVLNGVGYQVLGRPDLDGAIEVFRHNVSLYPDSANVFDSLAEALEGAGRLREAAENYAKAVENAKKNDDARLDIFQTNLERVQKRLADPQQNEDKG